MLDDLTRHLAGAWDRIRDTVIEPRAEAGIEGEIAARARAAAPVLWLFGKVGSGKTSIVRTLTGRDDAAIGTGFRPCTRRSLLFDFPAEAPVIRFLDTRGLGEVEYDPAEDIALLERQAHLVLVTMRALDPVQGPILGPLRQVRRRHPEWPLLVAQTALHDAYPHGAGHVLPYPFDGASPAALERVPEALRRALGAQRAMVMDALGTPAAFVAIDFTLPDDGLAPADYGADALWRAIGAAAPQGFEALLRGLAGGDARSARAHPHILGYAGAAAAIDLVPVVGLVAVPVVQGKLLHSLAAIHGTAWDTRSFGEFAGALGGGFAARYGVQLLVRQIQKLIPGWGWTAGAVSAAVLSFTTTYALGKAASFYLSARARDAAIDTEAVTRAYAEALTEAIALARRRHFPGAGKP